MVARTVSERSGEIAVRIALGANPPQIVQHFLAIGLRAGIAGVVLGLSYALCVEKWLSSVWYNVRPFDLATFGEAGIVILAVAGLYRSSGQRYWPPGSNLLVRCDKNRQAA